MMEPSFFFITMNNTQVQSDELEEKVFYCLSCHSLCILTDESLADEDWDGSYCGKCFSTHVGVCTIGEWLEEEERRKAKRREIEWSK
jgi:hypothetical protein